MTHLLRYWRLDYKEAGMNPIYAALFGAIAALCGAFVGAIASIGGTWLAQRAQSSRERLKLATEMARADREEFIKVNGQFSGKPVLPLSVYIAYHADLLQAAAKGKLNPAQINRIDAKNKELVKAVIAIEKEKRREHEERMAKRTAD
jgi:hypothetical protein